MAAVDQPSWLGTVGGGVERARTLLIAAQEAAELIGKISRHNSYSGWPCAPGVGPLRRRARTERAGRHVGLLRDSAKAVCSLQRSRTGRMRPSASGTWARRRRPCTRPRRSSASACRSYQRPHPGQPGVHRVRLGDFGEAERLNAVTLDLAAARMAISSAWRSATTTPLRSSSHAATSTGQKPRTSRG